MRARVTPYTMMVPRCGLSITALAIGPIYLPISPTVIPAKYTVAIHKAPTWMGFPEMAANQEAPNTRNFKAGARP
jgi:hypothetical protein